MVNKARRNTSKTKIIMGTFITVLILGFILQQLLVIPFFGGRVSKFNEDLYSNLDTNRMNTIDYRGEILRLPYGIGPGDSVVRVPFNFYGRYRITGQVGLVKRKSKLDKEIEEYFKIVIDRENTNRINNANQYKKKEEKKSILQIINEKTEPIIPEDTRTLFEELRSGKIIHMYGKEYKMVEHKEDSVAEQLDEMLRESINN